jgi:hypothetical protein
MSIKVTVQGIEHSTRVLSGLPQAVEQAVHQAYLGHGARTIQDVLAGMVQYPPERPGQRYVRTGRLGDSWTARAYGKYHITFKNAAPYARYVIGDGKGEGQAWMHKGRWWTAVERIATQTPRLLNDIWAAIETSVNTLVSSGRFPYT